MDNFTSIEVGKPYLIMTVTHYFTGVVKGMTPTDITLDECAWIPNTGRLNQAIAKGVVEECEPVGDGVVLRAGTIVAAIPWPKPLPTKVKP